MRISTINIIETKDQPKHRGFVQDIEAIAVENDNFRKVLYTSKYCQLVVMALKSGEDIGLEMHGLDQFFRIEEGAGEVVLDGVKSEVKAGFAIVIPAGIKHNVINTGSKPLRLYSLYSPPNHRDGVVHRTKEAAEADKEKFDGVVSEHVVSRHWLLD